MRGTVVVALVPFLVHAGGCDEDGASHGDVDDAGDRAHEDGETESPGDADAPLDESGPGDAEADADVPDGPSVPSPPATVTREGGPALLLRGTVLAPDGPLDPGDVLIGDDGNIACVAADCSAEPAAAAAAWIETHGEISPGLIDAHNHVAYNFLPEWIPDPPRLFENRYQWADDPGYENHVLPYTAHRSSGSHFCPAAKWGELRSVVHATTTMQGQSFEQGCINWGIRNAESYHGLGYDHMRTTIGSPRDITDADAADYIASFEDPTEPTTRFAVHMAEGYAGDHVTEEFDSFAGRDPRANRHAGVSLLYPDTALLIHSIPLTPPQILEAAATGSKVVWSPSSNIVLYGVTAPIADFLAAGLVVALGPDWTPSGEDDMLAEMRFALAYGESEAIAALTPERIWRMATSDGASAVGLEARTGRLAAGFAGDVAVFGRTGPDPYRAALDSDAADVRLVLLGGRGWFGDENLEPATARNASCDAFDACGTAKYLCVSDGPEATDRRNETLADIRTQLYNILEGVGYPPEEQYHRGSELLELADCGP
jgi:cytosine/adenosine deaminase-related metal-dependent hydrolase